MDWDKIDQLLSVAERALKWPQLKSLHDLAIAEVVKLSIENKKSEPTTTFAPKRQIVSNKGEE